MLLNYYNQQKIGALAIGRQQQSDIINCHFYSKKNNNKRDNLAECQWVCCATESVDVS